MNIISIVRPHLVKDITKLEAIQRTATKYIPFLRNEFYEGTRRNRVKRRSS